MKLVQHHYFNSTVDTDGLVLWHRGIIDNNAEYAPMRFELFSSWQIQALQWCLSL